jgi:hypothetical protein
VRSKIVFTVLVLMFVAYAVLLAARPRTPHVIPSGLQASASVSAPATASSSVAAPGSASAPPGDAGTASAARDLARPLRLAAPGWDLLAPGIIANQGLAPGKQSAFAADGLDVALAPLEGTAAVEEALARGGEHSQGADVVIVPLPSLVASFERLAALDPQVFFVAGWSRGREALRSRHESLGALPATGEVRVAAVTGSAALYFGLFMLEVAGVPASRVRLAAPDSKPGEVALSAVGRDTDPGLREPGPWNVLMTTAEAPRMIPIVAVAQASFVARHASSLAVLSRRWLDAEEQVRADAGAAARRIAAEPGAPEPVAMIQRLGWIAPCSLADNARAVGLAGRGAVTLESSFQRAWQIWRAARVLTAPAPEAAPVSTAIVASLVRTHPALVQPPAAAGNAERSGRTLGSGAQRAPIALWRAPEGKLDEQAFVAQAGFLAGVFERSGVRVGLRGPGGLDLARTKRVVDATRDRFDIAPGRLLEATALQAKGAGWIEILSVP